jgi:hypothetical protein
MPPDGLFGLVGGSQRTRRARRPGSPFQVAVHDVPIRIIALSAVQRPSGLPSQCPCVDFFDQDCFD